MEVANWSLNGQRRDLTADQRAALWLECNEHPEAWQRKRAEIRDKANQKRSDTKKGVVVPQVEGTLPSDKNVAPRTFTTAFMQILCPIAIDGIVGCE